LIDAEQDENMGGTTEFMRLLEQQIGYDRPFASNVELAKKSGLAESTIRRLRAGDTPGLRTLRKLSDVLLVPMEDLQRMAGILEADRELHDELTGILQSIMNRLPEEGKKAMIALGKELLRQQQTGK
jgi:transcriptional regulator with XRE-family HTH domain